jgi:hypothetical protein
VRDNSLKNPLLNRMLNYECKECAFAKLMISWVALVARALRQCKAMDFRARANSPNSNNVEHFAGSEAWARFCQGRAYERLIISSHWF